MISVCITTHNGEKFIKEELLSILAQLDSKDEIIISDDGSTDNTLDEINSLQDKRIVIHRFVQPEGRHIAHYYVCKNFENALKKAKGDIIFLADQDDWWYPNKVKECVEGLKDSMAVMHDLECTDKDLKSLGYTWYTHINRFRRKNFLMINGKHMGCAMAFRKELLHYILPFPKNLLLHDFWIGIIAEMVGGCTFIGKPLIKYRIHNSNTSRNTNNSLYVKIQYRIYTIGHVIGRCLTTRVL